MLIGFDPVIAQEPRIMILGSMPSVTSLEKQEYYGFAHNRFWKFMHRIYDMPISTYEEKKEIIYTHHMILWDVIHSCERQGSLDSAIHHETVNDIEGLLQNYSGIKQVICNGRKSYDLYQKHFQHLQIPCMYLPSTSNANRSLKEEVLFECWSKTLSQFEL